MPEFLTVKEVTKIFRLKKEETVREWIKKGVFPNAIRLPDTTYLVPSDDVRERALNGGASHSLFLATGEIAVSGADIKTYPISTLSRGTQTRIGLPLTLDANDSVYSFDMSSFIQPCIYFLLDTDGLVLYVGQTINLASRLASHLVAGKQFARVAIHPAAKENLNEIESKFIEKYRPPLNRKSLDGKWL